VTPARLAGRQENGTKPNRVEDAQDGWELGDLVVTVEVEAKDVATQLHGERDAGPDCCLDVHPTLEDVALTLIDVSRTAERRDG
jgi:hypothetical protein